MTKSELKAYKVALALIEAAMVIKSDTLDLSDIGLTKLPNEITKLFHLKELNISGNRLASFPEEIFNFTQLKKLWLNGCQLSSLPSEIGRLIHLHNLDISFNQLRTLPKEIGNLNHLNYLDLSYNQLTRLPEEICNLVRLTYFDITYNQLIILPDNIGNLTQLIALFLSDNKLTTLPESTQKLRSLERLFLHENKNLELPVEILGPTWNEVIKSNKQPTIPKNIINYYFKTRGGKRPLNEAKLILVGRGLVGKTSLVNRLLFENFNANENKTDGINISQWNILLNKNENVRLNIWDFGGQEIMHATHQFFLTERSLYLLVLNGREGGEDADAEYWLKLITSFGSDSPVIIVMNKIKQHPFDLNRRGLELKYRNIHSFVKTDCADGTGIDELKHIIFNATDKLEHLRDAFPTSWFNIKEKLAAQKENFWLYNQYQKFCSENGENDEQAQSSLAGYLHNLGIILNYKDDPRLRDTHILNPIWLTTGIYRILNSEKLANQQGVLLLKDISDVLDNNNYPHKMHNFILDLMKKFELCFTFLDSNNHFLIPELLNKEEPIETEYFKPEECLNFQYHYTVLPEGLLPRFIVRTHILSEGQQRWRTGVILKFEGCTALVKADVQDKKVFISVLGKGEARRRLLGVIRSDFEHIHNDIKNLRPEEMVPLLNDYKVVISYKKLITLESKGIKTFIDTVGESVLEINVQELLNGVDLVGIRKKEKHLEGRSKPFKIFYCYSYNDESLRNELETNLKILQHQGKIDSWHDRRIGSGEYEKKEVDEHLKRADIILLLISPDFLKSGYCWGEEMRFVLDYHDRGRSRLIPILLRDSNWQNTPFAKIQTLPKDGIPIMSLPDRDEVWSTIFQNIEKIISEGNRNSQDTFLVSNIYLENIRCLQNVNLSLISNDSLKNYVMLFGDNGVGKTTLLRCIALGLSDITTIAAMINYLRGPFLYNDTNREIIRLEFTNRELNEKWYLETKFENKNGQLEIEQTPQDFPRERIFACGYGSARQTFGTKDYSEYMLNDSLGQLFNYEQSLQNPELAFWRIDSDGIDIKRLTEIIDKILMLEPNSTSMDRSGIKIRGPWGNFMPIGGLSDGYQATLSWIVDMFGWSFFFKPYSLLTGISGIVLLDEIEQHLHPSWQREIIQLLRTQFPNIQFFVSTHSPMCALATTALNANETMIVRLRRDESLVNVQNYDLPTHQRADNVLTSPLFDLYSASSFDISSDIEEYSLLASKAKPTKTDKIRLEILDTKIEYALGPYKSETERKIDTAIRSALEDELKELLSNKTIDFQIRDRIKKYFGGV